jgi:hypothetical protein
MRVCMCVRVRDCLWNGKCVCVCVCVCVWFGCVGVSVCV